MERLRLALAALGGVLLIAWADWSTGPELGFALFYLVPVLAVAWRGDRRDAVVLAVLAGAAWLLADASLHPWGHLPVTLWNAVTRLAIFVGMALLVSRVRRDRDRLAEQVEHEHRLARIDALTGLPNRRAFLEQLEAELARSRRHDLVLTLAYVDLDRFKEVNDRYGHPAGDEALRRIAGTLGRTVRGGDVVARIGGDEFAVLLFGVDAATAERVGTRIVDEIAAVGTEYPDSGLGATVGLYHAPEPPEDLAEFIGRADHAMYEAKRAGRGRVQVVHA